MIELVVDASVVVKWFIEENDSEKAILLRDMFIEGKVKFFIPSLLYFEVLNALKYSQLFDLRELNDAGESLENYGLKVVAIKDELRKSMIKIALEHGLSIYDACYLGLSIGLDKLFCTADEKIIKKLPLALKGKVKSLKQINEIFT